MNQKQTINKYNNKKCSQDIRNRSMLLHSKNMYLKELTKYVKVQT